MSREYPILARLYIGHNYGTALSHGPEHVRNTVVRALGAHGIAGATLTQGYGVWRGAVEQSTIVEVLCPTFQEVEQVRDLGEQLKAALTQEAVLLVTHEARSELL